jgi:hypothetical protein
MKTKRERYIPEGYTQFKPEIGDYPKNLFACYCDLEKLIAIFYVGKQSNPLWHIRFRDLESMKSKIVKQISNLMSLEDMKQKRKEERKEQVAKVQVGEIYYDSWGYDQTNIDFYQITGVKGKMFEITPIAKQYCGEAPGGSMSDNVLPVKDKFVGEPIWKRSLKMQSGCIWKTNETTKHYCSWYA